MLGVSRDNEDASLLITLSYFFSGGALRLSANVPCADPYLDASRFSSPPFPPGRSITTTLTVLADVFTRQATRFNETNNSGVEIGMRRQIAPSIILDAGIGTEVVGPSERELFFATVGVSCGF